jgi:hypothetical protein
MQRHPKTKKGQALVEFALAATLIFFLLAAAVDLGLMFFAVQGLHNAAQEGGTYGSRWLTGVGYGVRVLDENEIRDRVRHESGSRGGIGFVNLLDLNNDRIPDVLPDSNIANCGQSGIVCQVNPATGNLVVKDYIQVNMIDDAADADGDPTNNGVAPAFTPCTNSSSPTCYIRVSVAFDYQLLFPLSPTFTRQRQLRSSFVMRLRDSFAQNNPVGTAPVFQPATATQQVLQMTLVSYYWNGTGTGRTNRASIKVQVTMNGTAFNGASVTGTIHGTPVTLVQAGGAGNYSICNAGPFTPPGTNKPAASLSANNGTGGAVGPLSYTNPSTSASFPCP